MFKAIARLLSGHKTKTKRIALPDNRYTESEYVFYANLLTRGLTETEASSVLFKRCVAGMSYMVSKGYSQEQIEAMPHKRLLTIPTEPHEYEHYRKCARRGYEAVKFYGKFGLHQIPTPQQ